MIRRFDHLGVTWVDLESPTADEVAEVTGEFGIGPSLAYELVAPTDKPRVDVYPNFVYAVFHFPSLRHTHLRDETQEIDVLVGKEFLITTHYQPVDAVDDFARAFEVTELLGRATPLSSAYLLFELAERLYRESESELDAIDDTIDRIEEGIFRGNERHMVASISKASRELLMHKRILGNHAEILRTLETASSELLGADVRHYFHAVTARHFKALNRALAMADTLVELRETNLALLSTRQNEIMKNLTIMAFVTFPLTLIAAIFGMNTTDTPLLGTPHDFWIIFGAMTLLTIVFATYFKLRKWF